MTNTHWAVFALRDIQESLDCKRYDVASHHIDDAINAITARDAQCDNICKPRVIGPLDSLER